MERWSVSEFSTSRWSLEAELIAFPRMGIQSIGIWNQKIEDFERDLVEDWLFNTHTGVSSFSWIGSFTGCEGISHVDAIKFARENIKTAARIGADTVIVYPGSRNGHTLSHARRLALSALKELAPFAADFGVRLALEPMSEDFAGEWSIFRSFEETCEFVNEFDPRTLGLVFDLFHIGLDASIYDSLGMIADRIALVQLADVSLNKRAHQGSQCRKQLGDGDVQLESWITAIEGTGYDGFYEIELLGPEFEFESYGATLKKTLEWLQQRTTMFTPQKKAKI